MKIKWYGHACFRIEGDGIAIVTDPYTPEVAGLDPVDEPADVVIMSSATDKFHSEASIVPGNPEILNALEIAGRGPVEVNGVVFEALPTMESRKYKESPDENAFGLLMSLNMLIETPAGFDYTGADCSSWMRDTGFRETYVEHLVGPDSMVVGIK